MAVPWVPRKWESRPAITSAAMRPWRFAGPASATSVPLAGHEVADLDGVADGEDVRVAGAHLVVHADAPAFADLQAGILGEERVRADAEGEDDDVGREGRAGLRGDDERVIRALGEGRGAVVDHDRDAMPAEVVPDEAPELDVERRQHVAAPLEDRDIEAPLHEVLRHLQADEPTPDDHCVLRRPHGLEPRVALHAGEEARPPLDPVADGPRVRNGAHLEDARQVDAGQLRSDGGRAW